MIYEPYHSVMSEALSRWWWQPMTVKRRDMKATVCSTSDGEVELRLGGEDGIVCRLSREGAEWLGQELLAAAEVVGRRQETESEERQVNDEERQVDKANQDDDSRLRPAFYAMHEAYYAKEGENPEIMVGIREKEEGCLYEFAIRWRNVGPRLSPRAEVFYDSWQAFTDPRMAELFKWLSSMDGFNPSPDEVKIRLLELGFADDTPYPQDAERHTR